VSSPGTLFPSRRQLRPALLAVPAQAGLARHAVDRGEEIHPAAAAQAQNVHAIQAVPARAPASIQVGRIGPKAAAAQAAATGDARGDAAAGSGGIDRERAAQAGVSAEKTCGRRTGDILVQVDFALFLRRVRPPARSCPAGSPRDFEPCDDEALKQRLREAGAGNCSIDEIRQQLKACETHTRSARLQGC
jgi:hypothetical protein